MKSRYYLVVALAGAFAAACEKPGERIEAPMSEIPVGEALCPPTTTAEDAAAIADAIPGYLADALPLVPILVQPANGKAICSSTTQPFNCTWPLRPNRTALVTFRWGAGVTPAPATTTPDGILVSASVLGPTTHYKFCLGEAGIDCDTSTDGVQIPSIGGCKISTARPTICAALEDPDAENDCMTRETRGELYTGLSAMDFQGKELTWQVAACNNDKCSAWSPPNELDWPLPPPELKDPSDGSVFAIVENFTLHEVYNADFHHICISTSIGTCDGAEPVSSTLFHLADTPAVVRARSGWGGGVIGIDVHKNMGAFAGNTVKWSAASCQEPFDCEYAKPGRTITFPQCKEYDPDDPNALSCL